MLAVIDYQAMISKQHRFAALYLFTFGLVTGIPLRSLAAPPSVVCPIPAGDRHVLWSLSREVRYDWSHGDKAGGRAHCTLWPDHVSIRVDYGMDEASTVRHIPIEIRFGSLEGPILAARIGPFVKKQGGTWFGTSTTYTVSGFCDSQKEEIVLKDRTQDNQSEAAIGLIRFLDAHCPPVP